MEFACEFVYVPPSTNQKEARNVIQNIVKRSALLPPINKIRPRVSPPPPPTNTTALKVPQSVSCTPKIIELLEQKDEVKRDVKPTPFYENAAFHLKADTGVPEIVNQQPETQSAGGLKKKALLPPHMRPSSNSIWLPYSQPLTSPSNSQPSPYELPSGQPEIGIYQPWDSDYSYSFPEGTGEEGKGKVPCPTSGRLPAQKTVPPLPPRPSFMKLIPDYVMLPKSTTAPSTDVQFGTADIRPLPGNPNVILVSLGKLLLEENVSVNQGKPTFCSNCGSVLDSCSDNVVTACYFCQESKLTSLPQNGCRDKLFLLGSDEHFLSPADALLIFCIDISGSMSITSQVLEGEQVVYKTRLQFVQNAVLQCVHSLSQWQPGTRVSLITFNNQVTIHGYEEFSSHYLLGDDLMKSDYLKEVAFGFPTPPPLSETSKYLQREVLGLSESGATALGPAALVAIAMASRHPGSKVIICTDGKANTDLGNLEVEDNDARTLLSSTIFYQDLGEYAANQGVTVSVLSIEGTDCRLDELGRLSDRTRGKVVIASPNELYTEFEEIIENRTIATHCNVDILMPKTLSMRGEREAGHKANREVGNVAFDAELTLQFGGNNGPDSEGPAPGSSVSIQAQLRYRLMDGRRMLRVLTADRDVTSDCSAVLSSLSLPIIQLNSSQASAALAIRGRLRDAVAEDKTQRQLMERALEHNRKADDEEIYEEWIKTMEPIYNSKCSYTRKSINADTESLTDTGAALIYNLKHSNRKSTSLKNKQKNYTNPVK